MIRIGDRQQFATVRGFLGHAYAEESDVFADRVGNFKPELHTAEPPLVRMFFLGRAILPPNGKRWRRRKSVRRSPTWV
jgi:hypothetical protein